jgi:hypothetical protein
MTEERFLAEFRGLGSERVRSELLLRRWPPEKISAAREWLEREDTRAWQLRRGDTPAAVRAEWKKKAIGYAIFAVGLLFAAVRLFRVLKSI